MICHPYTGKRPALWLCNRGISPDFVIRSHSSAVDVHPELTHFEGDFHPKLTHVTRYSGGFLTLSTYFDPKQLFRDVQNGEILQSGPNTGNCKA